MISYLKLENFKSFSNFTFDLRGKNGLPKKIAFIYGENGSGKSNLISSFFFLHNTLETLIKQEEMKDVDIKKIISEINDADIKNDILETFIKQHYFTLKDLIDDYISLGSEGNLSLELGFYINNKEGSYILEFDREGVVFEELRYKLNKRVGTVFSIGRDNIKISSSVIKDKEYKGELIRDIKKYWGKHTFMSILFSERKGKNKEFFESRLNVNFLNVIKWFSRFSVHYKNSKVERAIVSTPFYFLGKLDKGNIKKKDDQELKAFENTLNSFFTQLYPDIKKVYYKFSEEDGGYSYELYLKKILNEKIIDIPFSLESTGTQKLLDIFPYLFLTITGSTVLVDEIDSGIHDLLMCEIIDLLSEIIEDEDFGQFIVTTHNTLLMKHLSNESVYVLSIDVRGNKEITAINEYKIRTQKTHSSQSRYLKGEYQGVPIIGNLDFSELFEETLEYLGHSDEEEE